MINISPISFTARNLKPRTDQPILQLTKKEKAQVKALEKERDDLIASAYKFGGYIDNNSKLSYDGKNRCYEDLYDLEETIESLNNKIRDIKVTRYAKQKAKLAKK